MIYAVTFSKPGVEVEKSFGKSYKKIRIRLDTASSQESKYYCEMFTEKQVFHKSMTEAEVDGFIENYAGKAFKNCVVRTEKSEITYLSNKKGRITKLEKTLHLEPEGKPKVQGGSAVKRLLSEGKKKSYLLAEGVPVPFLVRTGIMTPEGKVISSKFDKFRQINRFLEFIRDILPEVLSEKKEGEPLRIADFGCGKSYLTFAVHYYLTEVRKVPCIIEGLDLKKDVIDYCNRLVSELNLEGLRFSTGNIADYSEEEAPDIVVTLHACDLATDYALKYAVSKNAKAILSVPCCQHQVNSQLQKAEKSVKDDSFESLLKWGIVREKFSSLVTDVLRAEYLETCGYNVQMLEFIDMEHTPKNILIRAVKKAESSEARKIQASERMKKLTDALGISPEIMSYLLL